ncbi:MAG TPA: hypothetical protein PLU39_16850 [Armatimonadota bacterium]|nr:hypothetical protein [Armatimonadota bacterium]
MPAERWLLLRAGSRRIAAPREQVAGLAEAGDGGDASVSDAEIALSERLWGEQESVPGVSLRVHSDPGARVRVAAAEEISEECELLSLPPLLGRALGEESAVAGAILWRGQLVPVVGLVRLASGAGASPPSPKR